MWIYNRAAAATYAEAFAIVHNGAWPTYQFDCTNFVSQALYAGGWEMTGADADDDESWFGPDLAGGHFGLSRSWAKADGLKKFLRASGRAHECKATELFLGDVVQIIDHSGEADHSMMVSLIAGGEPCLSYHTTDRFNVPLSRAVQLAALHNVGGTLVYWKLHDFLEPKTPSPW